MSRRLAVALTVSVAVSGLAAPALAAKAKPKPIKGSYTVTLAPDPSKEGTSTAGMDGCSGLSPAAKNRHTLAIPAAGTLSVILQGDDPAKGSAPAGFDWDLYTYDAGGILGGSDGPTAHEETVDFFKKKGSAIIEVCNLDGLPTGTISWTFTYK